MRHQLIRPTEVQVHLPDLDGPGSAAQARFELVTPDSVILHLRRIKSRNWKSETVVAVLLRLVACQNLEHGATSSRRWLMYRLSTPRLRRQAVSDLGQQSSCLSADVGLNRFHVP